MFTVSEAIQRLRDGKYDLILGLTDAQALQRINEILERFYDEGTWRGVHATIDITTTDGVISLPADYLRLDALGVSESNILIPIKNQIYAFQPGTPGIQDWTMYGGARIAIDLGETTAGIRQYQVSGNTELADAMAFTGLARKRFVWITDTDDTVIPDCYPALVLAVRAMSAEDEQANELSKDLWAQAFSKLDNNLEEFEAPQSSGILQLDPCFTAARIPNIL